LDKGKRKWEGVFRANDLLFREEESSKKLIKGVGGVVGWLPLLGRKDGKRKKILRGPRGGQRRENSLKGRG